MAIAFVKAGGSANAKASPASVALTVPAGGHAVGNLVAVFFAGISGGTLAPTCTDSRGNSYTLQKFGAGTENPAGIFFSVLTTALLAGDTITVTPQPTVPTALAVSSAEFSGVASTTDGSNSGSGSSTTPSITAITTTAAADLVLAVIDVNGPSGDTLASNDTATYDGSTWQALAASGTSGGSATSNVTCRSAYLITSAAGSVNYKPTLGTSRGWDEGAVALKAAASGTTFTATVTGGVSFSGAFGPTQTNKKLTAAQSEAGSIGRAVRHGLSAALTLAGAATKTTARTLAGGATSLAGTLSQSRLHTLALSAAQAFTGSPVGKSTSRALTATATLTGTVARQTRRGLSAGATFTGAVAKSTGRTLAAASLTASGAVSRQTRKGLAATAAFAGAVGRSTARAITGGLSATGTTAKQTAKALQAASLTAAGTVSKLTSRALAAAQLTLSGALSSAKNGGSHAFTLTLSAALSASGVVQRQTSRSLAAAQGLAGTVAKSTRRTLAATANLAGTVGKQTGRGLSAAANLTGTVAKTTARQLVAAISSSGTLSSAAGALRQALSAVASFAGSLVALLKPRPHAPGRVTSSISLLAQATSTLAATASATSTLLPTATVGSAATATAQIGSNVMPTAAITSTITQL